MTLSRRSFVTRLSSAAALSAIGARSGFALGVPPGTSIVSTVPAGLQLSLAESDHVRTLAMRAIDAAKSAGALFADVRITRTVVQVVSVGTSRSVEPSRPEDSETLAIGVRALVDGYWGFAASPYWELDEAVQLARDAVAQAKVYTKGSGRRVEIGSLPAVKGTWTMPVELDPFAVPIEEKFDYLTARCEQINHYRPYVQSMGAQSNCIRQERVVANTEGSYFSQTVYATGGDYQMRVFEPGDITRFSDVTVGDTTTAGKGWEVLRSVTWDSVLEAVEEGMLYNRLPQKPIDVGRYDVVFDADVVASIVDGTIGKATELDRAMGYEANAGGTSFLGPDPMAILGTYKVGSSMVNVTADRNTPGGLSTVKWDDEGVPAHEFSLVKDGVVVDYQTTRESSAWLAPWYEKQGKSVASRGCAGAQAGDAITMQHRPNLRLEPATADVTRDDLIKQIRKGVFFGHSEVSTDFQARSGLGVSAHAREIVNGTLGARLSQSAFSFDTVELWKNIVSIGGRSSQRSIQAVSLKGQPWQRSFHSATAAPMAVTGVAVIDPMRKA